MLGHFRFQGAHFFFHPHQRIENALQDFLHRFLSRQFPLLGQVADPQSLLDIHAAGVGCFRARDDLHQCAFAAAVYPDQAHPFLFLQGKRNALQHLMGAEAFPDLLQRKDNHFSCSVSFSMKISPVSSRRATCS